MDTNINKKSKNDNIASSPHKAKGIGVALLLLISISAGFIGGWFGATGRYRSDIQNYQTAQKMVGSDQKIISSIVKKVGPSVVSIDVNNEQSSRNIFGRTDIVQQKNAGTGFIISKDGYVITNRHLVPAGTKSAVITLSDGTELTDVEVIGQTSEGDPLDVAFLKIKDSKGKELIPATLADSSNVEVGEAVVAIGNALGQFQNTVTSGIISGYGRSVEAQSEGISESLQNLFQTDAAINQGNSGGPLMNMSGDVIGMNVAVAGDAQGIGFAIPVNDIKGLVKSVLEKGKIERPYLGVRYISLTDDIATEYKLSVQRGAFIIPEEGNSKPSITPGSPAAKAGLQPGDVITKINDTNIDKNNSLTAILGKYAVDDEVTLTIVRGNNDQTVKVKLQPAP